MAEHAFPEISPPLNRVLTAATKNLPVGREMTPRFDSVVYVATGAVAFDLVTARAVLGSLESYHRVAVKPVAIMGEEINILAMVAYRTVFRFQMAYRAVGSAASCIELMLVAVVSGVAGRTLGE